MANAPPPLSIPKSIDKLTVREGDSLIVLRADESVEVFASIPEGELIKRPAINTDLDAAPGTRPRPSSHHSGGVHVAYCDGRAGFLSESVDVFVYARLLSHAGTLYGEPVLSGTEF